MRSFGKEGICLVQLCLFIIRRADLKCHVRTRLIIGMDMALCIMAPWAWFAPPIFWMKRGSSKPPRTLPEYAPAHSVFDQPTHIQSWPASTSTGTLNGAMNCTRINMCAFTEYSLVLLSRLAGSITGFRSHDSVLDKVWVSSACSLSSTVLAMVRCTEDLTQYYVSYRSLDILIPACMHAPLRHHVL